MATFGNENLDIEPWEYINECSPFEKMQLIDILTEQGEIQPEPLFDIETDFDKYLVSLIGKKHLVSKRDENFIKKLSEDNKYFG